jgi:hypothetical protein
VLGLILNNKQREELAKSLMKIAEYVFLTLVIGQVALNRFNFYILFLAILSTAAIYLFSLFVLRSYKEAN